jgi:Na+-transporting NADH:ubiquinone oxidoreductase subunit A
MKRFRIRRGLDLPLGGAPDQTIHEAPTVGTVAIVAEDYPDLAPSLVVREGDRVRTGQVLFHDRRSPDVPFVAPGAGVVRAIHRGARRALRSIVIDLEGSDEERWPAVGREQLLALTTAEVRDTLLGAGLWTALRTRPFGRIPSPDTQPHALFVTAIDTNPLAADPSVVIDARREAFADGLTILGRLMEAPIFLCRAPGADVPDGEPDRITVAEFAGPHPAGLVGTHVHLLAPASRRRTAWYIGYQDVIAIGTAFTTGRPFVERVVALAGPTVRRPRLLRTRLGASVEDLVHDELHAGACRVISGSALSGRTAVPPVAHLGPRHDQLTVLPDASAPVFVGALAPRRSWSFHRSLWPSGRRALTTSLHGHLQPMVPTDVFERVMPLDVLPTPLLRALLTADIEMAEALGCLELEEEDLALCTVLCPSKNEYGTPLRAALNELGTQS